MSKVNVKKFYDALMGNKEFSEELRASVNSEKPETEDEAAACVVRFAVSKGYDFSTDDLKQFESEAHEISSKEMDQINAAGMCFIIGGGFGGKTPVGGNIESGGGACMYVGVGWGAWGHR